MKTFLGVWLDSKKCFGKYFLVFGCVPENVIENSFLLCFSHFLRIQQILLQRIKIYKQSKKQKSKQKN